MNRRVIATICKLVLFASAILWAFPAAASPPSSTSPLYWQVDPDGAGIGFSVGDEIPGSRADVWQSDEGIQFRIQAHYLKPGHAYTVWVFAFNHPENCVNYDDTTSGPWCERDSDLFNPLAFLSLMWGAGQFAPENGNIFEGQRPRNSPPCAYPDWELGLRPDCYGVLIGPGLVNPNGVLHEPAAEIHFVIRDHGPDQWGVDDETTSINGGCALGSGIPVYSLGWGTRGTYKCNDPQGN